MVYYQLETGVLIRFPFLRLQKDLISGGCKMRSGTCVLCMEIITDSRYYLRTADYYLNGDLRMERNNSKEIKILK